MLAAPRKSKRQLSAESAECCRTRDASHWPSGEAPAQTATGEPLDSGGRNTNDSVTVTHLGVNFSKLLEHAGIRLLLTVVDLFDLVARDGELILGCLVVCINLQHGPEVLQRLVKVLHVQVRLSHTHTQHAHVVLSTESNPIQ